MSKFASQGIGVLYNSNGAEIAFSILEGYAASDVNESDGTYNYYGFLKSDGSWYIMRTTKTNTEIRYFAGTSDYTTNWTGRASLSYNYFNVIF